MCLTSKENRAEPHTRGVTSQKADVGIRKLTKERISFQGYLCEWSQISMHTGISAGSCLSMWAQGPVLWHNWLVQTALLGCAASALTAQTPAGSGMIFSIYWRCMMAFCSAKIKCLWTALLLWRERKTPTDLPLLSLADCKLSGTTI